MKNTASPLFSQYIIDGVQMEETPFSALLDSLDGNGTVEVPKGPFSNIVDEYMDKVPTAFHYDENDIDKYISSILNTARNRKTVDLNYPVSWTVSAINNVLMDLLFKEGHFTLQNILLMAKWDWNNSPAGNMAAFYDSTLTAGRYLFDLGIKLDRYFVEENHKECLLDISVRSRIQSRRKCPDTMLPASSDWLIYIPFDNGRFHLGGSALSTVVGHGSGKEPDLPDPDYFIDCYEVVRELIEDGVVVAGVPVGYGGLAVSAERFRGRKCLQMEIGGIMSARKEDNLVRAMFSELPGVLVEVRDSDYDYVDSQLMLQEVAYFPVGHPSQHPGRLQIVRNSRNTVSGILESLLNQASEGED